MKTTLASFLILFFAGLVAVEGSAAAYGAPTTGNTTQTAYGAPPSSTTQTAYGAPASSTQTAYGAGSGTTQTAYGGVHNGGNAQTEALSNSDGDDDSKSAGLLAGIIVGALAAVALSATAFVILSRRSRANAQTSEPTKEGEAGSDGSDTADSV